MNKPMQAMPQVMLAAICGLLIAGCKTAPAPDSGFLGDTPTMAAQRERFPFDHVWVSPEAKKTDYDSILIAPVNTDYLLNNTGWKAANPGNLTLDKAAKDLAVYTQEKFREAFKRSQTTRLADQPGPRTATLELAIVELVPSKAVLGAVGLVAPVVGAPVVGVVAQVLGGTPSVAIDGRLKNSLTGELLFIFADREERQVRIVDLKSVTWWGHARPIIADWARQSVLLTDTPKTYRVKNRSRFTLMPWRTI